MFALGRLLKEDSEDRKEETVEPESTGEVEVKIHPKLRLLAEEIIRDSEKRKS